MHPDLVSIGPVTIHWYGVLMALGFVAGLLNWLWVGRKDGRDLKFCSDLLFWIMVSGIVGARLAYVITDFPFFMEHPARIIRVDQGGLAFHGGFIGAWIALLFFARAHRIPFLELADFVIVSLPLAHAFGRIGCFMNGCCHGRPATEGWTVTYPAFSLAWHEHLNAGLITADAPRSLPVVPSQLYSALFNLLLYGVVMLTYRYRGRPGMVGVVYLLGYGAGRFLIEIIRGDDRVSAGGLTAPQWVSLGLVASGIALAAIIHRRGTRCA